MSERSGYDRRYYMKKKAQSAQDQDAPMEPTDGWIPPRKLIGRRCSQCHKGAMWSAYGFSSPTARHSVYHCYLCNHKGPAEYVLVDVLPGKVEPTETESIGYPAEW